MKINTLACAILALASCLGAAPASAAGMEGDANEKNAPVQNRRGALVDPVAEQVRQNEARALALRQRNPAAYQRRSNDDQRRNNDNDRWRDERGAGPDHQFRRGDRLPPQYRSRQYVVEDWRGHHLKAPPRGYQWVQTGGDYVLAAIATGVILELLLNN